MKISKTISIILYGFIVALDFSCSDHSGFSTSSRRKVATDDQSKASDSKGKDTGDISPSPPTQPQIPKSGVDALAKGNQDKDGEKGDDGEEALKPAIDGGAGELTDSKTVTFTVDGQNFGAPVEVVFVPDVSSSMKAEKTTLFQKMGSFIAKLEKNPGINIHVMNRRQKPKNQTPVPGAEKSIDELPITWVPIDIDSHDALQKIVTSITKKQLVLREQALKKFVIITDDDAEDTLAKDFLNFLEATPGLKDKSVVNAIAWIDGVSVATKDCNRADDSKQYKILTQNATYGGKLMDLCEPNWDKLLTDIADGILKEIIPEFTIDDKPSRQAIQSVTINGNSIADSDYLYDSSTGKITFINDAVAKADDGATIVITYNLDP